MAGKKKRIVTICSDGKWPACSVHPNFGRCAVFNFLEIGKGKPRLLESVANPFVDAPGAGISAASLIAEKKASAVVAGQFGPNASNMLSKWGIELVEATGAAEKALEKARVK